MARRRRGRPLGPLHEWGAPIPQLHLGTPLTILDGGTHRPLLCELEDDAGATALWVVKTPSMYGGTTTPLLRELICADLFAIAALPTPQAGLLRIPHALFATDDTDAGAYAQRVFGADAGRLAFCSAFIEAPPATRGLFIHRGKMSETILRDAVVLYALDRFTWHGDRTRGNPNCLTVAGRLVPIDHDRVFHGLDSIDDTGFGPSLDDELDPLSVLEHVAHELVAKHSTHAAWADLQAGIATLPAIVESLQKRWPDEWDRSFGGESPAGLTELVCSFLLHRSSNVVRIFEAFR